jgi:ubiquinone/menaquinone biosynthesis C-methylase UbiE|tara:strand:- start:55 stop:732 length:678 start_codon:yes stop_codon:yes gene_type:complete
MNQKNIFTKDTNNKDIIIDTKHSNYQVMMEWEKPYMEALIKNLNPKGNVLEIGFGLGYSATEIQKYKIKSHTIIESDKNVLEKLKQWSKKQKNKVNIVEGFWQDKLKTLNKFDSIFFDDAPVKEHPDIEQIRVYDFFYRVLKSNVNKNCTLSWYCCKELYWLCHPSVEWSLKKYKINIPNNCNYVQNKDEKSMYLPLLKFTNGTTDEIDPIGITRNFELKQLKRG